MAPNPNLGVQIRTITIAQKIKATLIEAHSHPNINEAFKSHFPSILPHLSPSRAVYFHTSIFFFDRIVLPPLVTALPLGALEPPLLRGLLLINLAGFLASQTRATMPFLRINRAPSSVTRPVVLAFVWVRWPLAGRPSL
jgi:hypothetical protein